MKLCKHCERLTARYKEYRPERTVNCRKGHRVTVGQPHPAPGKVYNDKA
ncbi:hypothetical protein LCGC14_1745820 [marine sediment metagenome]|uniref:Uncharacterized protein n=1 Tax=marine sediment metagenome TaxID=412755 RepID=A0A0F9H5E6_9ZZZZ